MDLDEKHRAERVDLNPFYYTQVIHLEFLAQTGFQ